MQDGNTETFSVATQSTRCFSSSESISYNPQTFQESHSLLIETISTRGKLDLPEAPKLRLPSIPVPDIPSLENSFEDTTVDDKDEADHDVLSVLFHDNFDEPIDNRVVVNTKYYENNKLGTFDKNWQSIESMMKSLSEKYKINFNMLVRLERIGQGAYGKVIRVFNKSKQEFYALKELNLDDFKDRERFEKVAWEEIKNLNAISLNSNEFYVEVLAISLDENKSILQIVMELGNGTLKEFSDFTIFNTVEWKEEDLICILKDLLKNVYYLKSIDLCHRDIKPANIILSKSGFKLADYGCSKFCKPGIQAIEIAGTPYFMSKELIEAYKKKKKICEHDPYASDVYSIGMTLLYIINPNLSRKDCENYLEAEISIKYPRLYQHLKLVFGSVEQRLNILERGFEDQGEKLNYAWNNDLRSSYRKFMFQKIAQSNPDINPEIYFEMLMIEDAELIIKRLLADDAVPSHRNLTLEYYLIRSLFAQVKFYEAKKRLELIPIKYNEFISNDNPKSQIALSHYLMCMGVLYNCYREYHQSHIYLFKSLELRKLHLSDDSLSIIQCYLKIGVNYHDMGDFENSMVYFEKSSELMSKSNSSCLDDNFLYLNLFEVHCQDRKKLQTILTNYKEIRLKKLDGILDVSRTYINIAAILKRLGQYEESNKYKENAIKLIRENYGENSLHMGRMYFNITFFCAYNKSDSSMLEHYCDKSLEVVQAASKSFNTFDMARINVALGLYYFFGGFALKSKRFFEKSAKEYQLTSNQESSPYLFFLNLYAVILINLGDYETAYDQIQAFDKDWGLPDDDFYAIIMLNLLKARILTYFKRYEEALELIDKSLNIIIDNLCEDSYIVGSVYMEYGRVHFETKNYENALFYFEEIAQKYTSLSKRDFIQNPFGYIGDIYFIKQDYIKAKEWYQKGRNTLVQTYYGIASIPYSTIVFSLGETLHMLGNIQKGLDLMKQAAKNIERNFGTESKTWREYKCKLENYSCFKN